MKTHTFTLEVKTHYDGAGAELALLTCFAKRDPDQCEFHLATPEPFKPLSKAIRDIADDLIPERAENDEVTREQRDAAELLRCLARVVERGLLTVTGVHDCFGSPGDFGYSHPVGKALAAAYNIKS